MQKQNQTDPMEEALAFLEKENREFENHWVWKRLACKPEQFFEAFKRHADSLNIPKEKWEEALEKAKDVSRVRAKEKRATFSPLNMQLMQSLQV